MIARFNWEVPHKNESYQMHLFVVGGSGGKQNTRIQRPSLPESNYLSPPCCVVNGLRRDAQGVRFRRQCGVSI
jgi:hypothetical protein